MCGAYALLVALERSIELPMRFGGRRMPKGRYCYVGNARGPGGMRVRCARHLRDTVTRHWHVDWLSAGACDRLVTAFPGQHECDFLCRLLGIADVSVPSPGSAAPIADDLRATCWPSMAAAFTRFSNASASASLDSNRRSAGGDPRWRC